MKEMENKRKALGKGLEQLFSGEAFNLEEFEKNVVDNANKDEILMINLNELRSNPYQPEKCLIRSYLKGLLVVLKSMAF